MAISNNSTGLRPGVCTSTTRPTAPYEGQVIFQKDTDQLLVWNGTAWVIPNQTTQNPTGLELIKTQAVGTTVTSVDVVSVFSNDYDNYLINYSGVCTHSGEVLRLRLGTTAESGYYGTLIYGSYASSVGSYVADNNTQLWTHVSGGTGGRVNMNAVITSPFLSTDTTVFSTYLDGANAGHKAGWLNNDSSYTSFQIVVGTGTITGGTITVYGYRK
jgi:hypothetical protein